MTMEVKIKTAATYKGMNQAKLATAIGMTPSNFNQKLKRGTFSEEEVQRIAEALGATFESAFVFPDGMRV